MQTSPDKPSSKRYVKLPSTQHDTTPQQVKQGNRHGRHPASMKRCQCTLERAQAERHPPGDPPIPVHTDLTMEE